MTTEQLDSQGKAMRCGWKLQKYKSDHMLGNVKSNTRMSIFAELPPLWIVFGQVKAIQSTWLKV